MIWHSLQVREGGTYPLIMQCKNTFQDENMGRVDGRCLLNPGMLFKRIDWHFGDLAVPC